jgi:hypothetical protein
METEYKAKKDTDNVLNTQKTGFNKCTDSSYKYISDDELTLADNIENVADIDALKYLNLIEANRFVKFIVPDRDISIAIIDSGMHPEVWDFLEYNYKIDIDYHECQYSNEVVLIYLL